MPAHELHLTDPRGKALRAGTAAFARATKIVATREANRISTIKVTLPADTDPALLQNDNILQLWRQPDGGRLGLWWPYFIRKYNYQFREGQEELIVTGVGPKHLLFRRIVAERKGTSVSSKNGPADDLMKAVVREAHSDGSNPTPVYGTRAVDGFDVAPDSGDGPTIERQIEWTKLLTLGGSGVLSDFAQASRNRGTPLYFEVLPRLRPGDVSFTFQTFTNSIFGDPKNYVTFSLELGNMSNPQYEYDATKSVNYAYAIGRGTGDDQTIEQQYAAARHDQTKWSRSEVALRATMQDDASLADAAKAYLQEHGPKVTMYAQLLSTRGATYGVDWDYGHKVVASYHGIFTAVIEAVMLTIEDQDEQVDAKLRGGNA